MTTAKTSTEIAAQDLAELELALLIVRTMLRGEKAATRERLMDKLSDASERALIYGSADRIVSIHEARRCGPRPPQINAERARNFVTGERIQTILAVVANEAR